MSTDTCVNGHGWRLNIASQLCVGPLHRFLYREGGLLFSTEGIQASVSSFG